MFSAGLLLSAGATLILAVTDKALEETGFYWVSTILKLTLPIVGMALGVYFLNNNPILGWLK